MAMMNAFIVLLAVVGCAIPGFASEEQFCSGPGVCNAAQDDSTAIMQKKIEVASTASVEGKDAGTASGDSENVAVQSHEVETGVVDAEEEEDNSTNPKEVNVEEEDNLAQLTYELPSRRQNGETNHPAGGPGCPPELGFERDAPCNWCRGDRMGMISCYVQHRFAPSKQARAQAGCNGNCKLKHGILRCECPPDNTRPNWPRRFPKNGITDDHDLAPLGDLFSQKTWEDAVTHAFGTDALHKIDNNPHPNIVHNINNWCSNHPRATVAEAPSLTARGNIRPTDLSIAPIPACSPDSPSSISAIKKSPYMRALSVDNLIRIKKFLRELDDLGGRSGDKQTPGQLYNPSKAFGKSCSENLWRSCSNDGDCQPHDGTCTTYLAMNVKDVNLHVVNEILVKPLTHYSKLSFAEHTGGAGVPDFFISHNWGGKTVTLIDTVIRHFERAKADGWKKNKKNTFYWVCTFSNNQQNIEEEVGDSIFGPFWYGIQLAQATVNVQDDQYAADTFTGKRAWCVFELAVSYFFKVPYSILCESGAQADTLGYYALGRTGNRKCTPTLQRQLLSFSAQASETNGSPQGLQNKADILTFIEKTFCLSAVERNHPAFVPASGVQGLDGKQCIDLLVKEIGIQMQYDRSSGHVTDPGHIDGEAAHLLDQLPRGGRRQDHRREQILSAPVRPDSDLHSDQW